MFELAIDKLAEVINAEVLKGDSDKLEFTSVVTDSRQVAEGCCFWAIEGENFDGHEFIGNAFSKGAVCAVVSKKQEGCSGDVLVVENTIEALGDFGRWYRNQLGAKVVAITGSAGKTTTRQMVYHVLKEYFNCHQSPKSFNNNIGLPLTLLSANKEHDIILTELGTNAPGEIKYLTNIAQPDIAVVLNALPVHLKGLGAIGNIIAEKTSIAAGLKKGGSFWIKDDKAIIEYCHRCGYSFRTFGGEVGSDVFAMDVDLGVESSSMVIEDTKVMVPLPFEAAVENAVAAWAVCKTLGVTISKFAERIKSFEPVSMRMQIEKLTAADGRSVTLINDCYNANPASMANALKYLARVKNSRKNARAVFICGTMGELGAESEKLHSQTGELAGELGVDVLLGAGEFTDCLAMAAKEKNPCVQEYIFESTERLCNKVHEFVLPDDIILVKGSRSARLELATAVLKKLFS